jgi:hypothetical protein
MNTFTIKQNDTSPALVAELKDSSNVAIDLTGATVTFSMKDPYGRVVVNKQAASVRNTLAGEVAYYWEAGDTSQAGNNYAEFQITFDNGQIQTVPNDSDILVKIAPEVA